MAKKGIIIGNIEIVPRKSSPLMKVVVAVTILLSAASLITLRLAQWDAEGRLQVLGSQITKLREANSHLAQQIDDLGTVDSIRQLAAEKLGLVDPDTIIIDSE